MNPVSGAMMNRRKDVVRPEQMTDRLWFEPSATEEVPTEFYVPAAATTSLDLLRKHGIQMRQLTAPVSGVEQFVISQAARELEAVTLLTRTTQWSPNPTLAMEANRIAAPLTSAWSRILLPGPLLDPTAVYRGLSLGHAQLARIRLLPVLPDEANAPPQPFVVALRRIEQENGRMLQTQIRLLKNVGEDIPLDERERLIEDDQQLVDGVFGDFLAWLAA